MLVAVVDCCTTATTNTSPDAFVAMTRSTAENHVHDSATEQLSPVALINYNT